MEAQVALVLSSVFGIGVCAWGISVRPSRWRMITPALAWLIVQGVRSFLILLVGVQAAYNYPLVLASGPVTTIMGIITIAGYVWYMVRMAVKREAQKVNGG